MHDDQIRGMLRKLEDDRVPDPAFADALYQRLHMVADDRLRSRTPFLLLAAALLTIVATGIALGSGLLRLPETVDASRSPLPTTSGVAVASPTASARSTTDGAPSGSPRPSAEPIGGLAESVLWAAADGLRLREEPSSEAEIVATLRAGQLMGATGEVTSADGMTWYRVAIGFRGIAGWIANGPEADWLRRVDDGAVAFRCDGCGIQESIISVTPFGDDDIRSIAAGTPLRDWDWSPDGTRLAGTIDPDAENLATVVVLDSQGGNEQRLGSGYSPRWSPDGSRLAWTTDDDVIVTDADLQPVALGLDLLRPSVALWSPDGMRLAITALECPVCAPEEPIVGDVPTAIYRVDIDGSNALRLTEPNYDSPTSWSADGFELSFLRFDLSGEFPTRAFTISANGGNASEILGGAAAYGGLLWSPDGSRVAYAIEDGVVVRPADGTGEAIEIAPPDGTLVTELHWSPSGRYVLFGSSGDDGTSMLWIARADGSAPARALAPADATATQASWQPVLSPID
jgi:dipeptidyl aminopeptidase/acylaminoacyl peptidase